jgi:hypothetical protein
METIRLNIVHLCGLGVVRVHERKRLARIGSPGENEVIACYPKRWIPA